MKKIIAITVLACLIGGCAHEASNWLKRLTEIEQEAADKINKDIEKSKETVK